MSAEKKRSITDKAEPIYRYIFVRILVITLFIILFAVRLHIEKLSEDSLKIFASPDGMRADWFLYCKEIMLLITAAAVLCYAAGERIFPDRICRENPLYDKRSVFPLCLTGVYLLFMTLSSLFSEHRDVTFTGVCGEFEGLAAIISYCVLFLAGYNFFTSEKDIAFFRKALQFFIMFCGAAALLEYTAVPVMKLPFIKYIAAPEKYRQIAETMEHANGFRESVLMFFNSDYFGGFCTIIIPVSLYYVFSAEKTHEKLLSGITAALAYTAVITSNSTAALYTAISETAVTVTAALIQKKFRIRNACIAVISAAAVFIAADAVCSGDLRETLTKGFTNSGTFSETENMFVPEKIRISEYSIYLSGNGSEYKITVPTESGTVIKVSGINNTAFSVTECRNNVLEFCDENTGAAISLFIKNGIAMLSLGYDDPVKFAVTTDGLKAVIQNSQLSDTVPENPFNSHRLSKYYRAFTGRGFVWLNTLPILKECIFIGKGPGNFAFRFIQWDTAGLLRTHGTHMLLIDKPHSWYLQTAVSGGIPSLLAMTVLFAYFVVSGFRTIFIKHQSDMFMSCLYTGLCGFMITGTVNDSMVTVNPFFWFCFGIAFCFFHYKNRRPSQH